jgi:hypothetical protein
MFKVNHLFGNGSVPSIGGTTLAAALAGVERAEQALEAARALARSAAKREGRSVRSLFEDSKFILRASGEKWADTARAEGEKAMIAIFSRSVAMDAADENSPFHFLAKRLSQPGALRAQQAEAAPLESQKRAEQIIAAAARARHSGENERPMPSPDSVAGQILAAAKKAHRRQGDD